MELKPFIKWAGGKTQLLPKINTLKPANFNIYYEPFLGGGSVLFNLMPNKAVINDLNTELINVYNQIKINVSILIDKLSELDFNHKQANNPKEFYNAVRNDFNECLNTNTVEQAARFIFINKHCFNGLYRVNSKNKFNVPYNGNSKSASFEESNLLAISNYLNNNNIVICANDFFEVTKNAKPGDFVFFDSPYDNSFTDYTKESFTKEDHIRLANLFKELSNRNVYCMLTNHNTELINDLYKDFSKEIVTVKRNINSNGTNRSGEEIIIKNY